MTRILLVEADEGDARRVDASLRARAGWEVVRAASLLEAIRAAGDERFDAAVLDADLPDGSGLDILDFLRIGSPGIRILLLARDASPALALHALSHGAGDLVGKDAHLELELPRRMDALLDEPAPAAGLVESVTPLARDEPPTRPPDARPSAASLDAALEGIVAASALGAGVWDMRGRPVALRLPPALDGDGVGFALATLHGQLGALWTYGDVKPTGYRVVVDVEGGVLAVTAIPGTYVVAILLEPGCAPWVALERADAAAARVLAALQGGPVEDP